MVGKERIQSFLDAFSHGSNLEYYEGACHGLRIALASLEMEEIKHGKTRKDNHESNIRNPKPSNETCLRANEKRTQGRSKTI